MRCSSVSENRGPKEYYMGMLNCEPAMLLNREEAGRIEGLRSVNQLEEMIDQLMPQQLGDGFTPTVFACF